MILSRPDGLRTNSELIRQALRVYDWLLTESQKNDEVHLQTVNGGKVQEIQLFLRWPPKEG